MSNCIETVNLKMQLADYFGDLTKISTNQKLMDVAFGKARRAFVYLQGAPTVINYYRDGSGLGVEIRDISSDYAKVARQECAEVLSVYYDLVIRYREFRFFKDLEG